MRAWLQQFFRAKPGFVYGQCGSGLAVERVHRFAGEVSIRRSFRGYVVGHERVTWAEYDNAVLALSSDRENSMTSKTKAQAKAALEKAMNEKCSNFDRGAVFHWAERGFYCLTDERDQALATVGAVIEEATHCGSSLYATYGADRTDRYAKGFCAGWEHMRNEICDLNPDATAILKRMLAEARAEGLREAAEIAMQENERRLKSASIRIPALADEIRDAILAAVPREKAR